MFALGAGETLPMVAPWLRNLLLSLKHLVGAGVMHPHCHLKDCTPFQSNEDRHLLLPPHPEAGCNQRRAGSPSTCDRACTSNSSCNISGVTVSQSQICVFTDIIVWPLSQHLVVQGAFTFHALEALAVVGAIPLFRKLRNQQTRCKVNLIRTCCTMFAF